MLTFHEGKERGTVQMPGIVDKAITEIRTPKKVNTNKRGDNNHVNYSDYPQIENAQSLLNGMLHQFTFIA